MTKRLFLGIALDTQQTQQIDQLQTQLGKSLRRVPVQNLHMTLAFLGPVSDQIQVQLEAKISIMHKPKFQQTLNTLTHWEKPHVLCLTGQKVDPCLAQLAKECYSLTCLFSLQKNAHLFAPHITLARKVSNMQQSSITSVAIKTLFLSPTIMHLYHSQSTDTGVQYHILRSWQLE